MQKFAKLFLPLLALFVVSARHAEAINTIAVNPAAYSVNENAGQVGVVVSLTRDPSNTQVVTVNFATSNGTAIVGSDYFGASGTLTFAANESAKLVQLSIINDFISESTENFFLTLSAATNAMITTATATITIVDDDGSADGINFVSFSSADYGTVETLGPGQPPAVISLVLNVQRRGDPNQPLNVQLDIGQAGDTAVNGLETDGADYNAPASQVVTFPPQIDQVVITVPIFNRPGAEGNRFFTANLISVDSFTSVGQPASARSTIFDNSGPNTVRLLSDTFRVQENSQYSFTIPVFRTGGYSDGGTNVNYTTEIRKGDTAVEGVNFLAASGTINFAPIGFPVSDNQHIAFITIIIPNNELIQGDVTFHLTLTSSDVAQLGPVSTTQIIVGDDDAGNVVQFSAPTYSVSEAGPYATVTVNLIPSGDPTKTSIVDFSATSITAFAGFDFAPINTTLVFQPGEFVKTVQIPIFEDSITEPAETFRVTLSNPGLGTLIGSPSTSIVTILDDDLSNIIQFSPTDYSVAENGGPVTLTVFADRANNPDDTITVHYQTVSNTATAGADFTAIPTGTLVFGPGETQKSFTVAIVNDKLIEGAENFFVQLTDASSVTPTGDPSSSSIGINSTATVTILDDDSTQATIGFSQSTFTVDEGAGFANLTVTRSGGLGVQATVDYSTTDGTAIAGVNYIASTGSITFGVGEVMKTISIPIIDDATTNPTLSFTVTLTAPDGGFVGGNSQATVNIIDNDATTFRFNPGTYSVDEGSGTVTLTVEALRVGDPSEMISVDYSTSDGTATDGSNYTHTSGRLTFGPNIFSQTITVPIIDNSSTDGTTSFAVTLSNPLGDGTNTAPRLGTPSVATVSIIDNDATTFQFASPSYTVNNQAGSVSATITLSRIGDPNTTYSVSYATSDLTAKAGTDYMSKSGTLTFSPGLTSKVVTITLINEPVGSPTRQFAINLSNPTNGAFLGTTASTVISIVNPDLSTKPVNISTRGLVESGDGVMIAGFIIQGNTPKQVIIRGLGPSLTQKGVINALQDPTLDLRDSSGAQLVFDDNYKDSQETEIEATGLAPTDDREAAIVVTLAPGSYTAILRSTTNGVGLVEVYDLDTTSATLLVNISTRATVGSDDNTALIGGFIISGQVSHQVMIRALGPSLTGAGVDGALPDPTLDFYRGSELILSNDNWKSDNMAAIEATGLAPTSDKESAILVTLDPGSYSAVVRGKGSTTGIGLVEVYQMP
jgi:hypothetical protein